MLARYVAAVPLRYRDGRAVQAQGAAGVAEPPPGPYGLTGRLGGQVGGSGPAGEPLLVDGQDPAHGGLLEHELADHDAPGAGLGAAPGQVAGVLLEPGDDRGVQRVGGGVRGLGRLGRLGGLGDLVGCPGCSHDTGILACFSAGARSPDR